MPTVTIDVLGTQGEGCATLVLVLGSDHTFHLGHTPASSTVLMWPLQLRLLFYILHAQLPPGTVSTLAHVGP